MGLKGNIRIPKIKDDRDIYDNTDRDGLVDGKSGVPLRSLVCKDAMAG